MPQPRPPSAAQDLLDLPGMGAAEPTGKGLEGAVDTGAVAPAGVVRIMISE
jgi:hypothetical protein